MNKILTVILFFFSSSLFSQIELGYQGLIPIHIISFEDPSKEVVIDTTNQQNNWVIGSTNKTFFGQANSLPNAIMTDSVNSYSPNNHSYFDLGFRAWDNSGFPFNMYIQFDHKYETDSLIDGGFITVSYDTGQTWVNVINDSSCVSCYSWPFINSENLYTFNDSLKNGNFGFSGTSDWKTTTFQWIWMLPVAKEIYSDTMIVRFNFISDSIQTNKDGWIIDNINVGFVDLGSSIQEINNQLKVELYPNLTNQYFNYKMEDNDKLESLFITDVKGQIIYSEKNPNKENRIDVSKYPSGIYFVKFSTKGKQVVKKLIIN